MKPTICIDLDGMAPAPSLVTALPTSDPARGTSLERLDMDEMRRAADLAAVRVTISDPSRCALICERGKESS